ncbi:hypothetical protein N9966_00010 [bacterium]|nr:hypothetical protein [bacterium]
MPAINPEDYNIDNFNSQNLGPITLTDFRSYVLKHNLPGLDPVLAQNGIQDFGINIYAPSLFNPNPSVQDLPNLSEVAFLPSPINDNTTPRPDNKQRNLWTNEKPFYGSPTEEETFDVTTKSLEDPGSIDVWTEEAGFTTDVFTVRNFNNLTNNEYGPEYVETYNDPDQPLESTGYQQYPSSSGSDVLGPIIARSLGFSPESYIDFPSDLQTVGTERRATELSNRIALNFVDETVGKLNLDPLGLLAGQSLFLPDYTITKRKGILGKAAQFTANLTGFNFPKSILPGGDQIVLGSNAFQEDLIDYTGRAQKKVLYANVYSNKYNPELLTKGWGQEDSGKDTTLQKIGGFFENLNPTKKRGNNYLRLNKKKPDSEPKNLFGKIGAAINDAIVPGDDSLIPLVDKQTNPSDPFVVMGTEGQYPSVKSINEDPNSNFNELELSPPPDTEYGSKDGQYFPNNTTLKPSLTDGDNPLTPFTQVTPSTKNLFYWQNRQQSVAKRGLLDFTQKMVNNAEAGGNRGAASFIGRFDSDSNLVDSTKNISGGDTIPVSKHRNVSKGNLVRESGEDHYCRSWSTRSPYQNHYDLIRRNKLYRAGGKAQPDDIASGPFFGPYQSVLEETGHVKVGPTTSDDYLQDQSLVTGLINQGNDIKRFMFSIENLAWTDAPQKIGLDPCEIGPNGGRIMWFPPYDITFTDNTTSNWNSEVFIGRAEPIYTYNHTERKGTLSWSIITDHPSVLNKLKDRKEQELLQFFAGCGLDISEFFETTETEIIETPIEQEEIIIPDIEVVITPEIIPDPRKAKEPPVKELSFYFRNARTDGACKGRKCKGAVGRTIQDEIDVKYDTGTQNSISKTKKGDYLMLNEEWLEKIDSVIDFLATPEGQNWCVEFNGNCSAASTDKYNQMLSIDRATRVYEYVVGEVKKKGEAGPPPPGGTLAVLNEIERIGGYTAETEYYVYEENNFGLKSFGWICKDGDRRVDKRTSYRKGIDEKKGMNSTKCSDCYSVGKANGYYPYISQFYKLALPGTEEELSESRWVIVSNSEDYARDKDQDGDPLESENADGTVTSVGIKSTTAKEDRRVTIKLFKNHKYIQNTEAAKNNAEKLAFINEGVDRLELAPITPIENTIIYNDDFIGPLQEGDVRSSEVGDPGFTFEGPFLAPKDEATSEEAVNSVGNENIQNTEGGDTGENVEDEEVKTETIRRNVQKLFKECEYFEALKVEDPFVYEGIKEKIKFFQPAFHSMTPEGLNSRLTFLQQCMRQGPSLRENTNQTQNMAFGKPPVLVLRIGDFYYTKIIPDSLNINYEPLQWDMNPEGVGVQPMIAKVDLNFSIIGGSSLDGPIRQLQNAVSFNFFANTSVYNPRRYYDPEPPKVDENGNLVANYQSLEQKLEGEAQEKDSIIKGDIIGFGAFKNQYSADLDRTNPSPASKLVRTSQDNKPQESGITSTNSKGEELPAFIDIDSDGIPDTIDGEITASPADTPEDPTAFLTQGLFGNSEDQQMIKDMFPGAITPEDDLAEIDNYEVTFTNLNKSVTLPPINGSTPSTIWLNTLFPNPDGNGGVTLQWSTFSIKNFKLGWLVKKEVDLKLTYPDGTIEEFSDSSYVLTTFPNKEEIIAKPPYADYNTLNTGPNKAFTSSIFQIEEFFTDWFTKNSRTNGTHKLEVTWTYTREVTSDNAEAVVTSVGVGTQPVGQLVNKTYTETFEYDLYSKEYPPYPEDVADIIAGFPPGTFFP